MGVSEKTRKRRLGEGDEDEFYGEGDDTFNTDADCGPRRGRKEGRRVSGVYREIKSLQSIGSNASVMERVFEKMSLKEVMTAGCSSTMWYITACHELRKRYGNSPFLRLWSSEKSQRYQWMEWELHFHEQFLAGTEAEDMIDDCSQKSAIFPAIDTIISIGSRSSYPQFYHEDAKLPIRQDFIYLTCGEAIVTTPDYSYTGTVDEEFGFMNMVVQSYFIPKSSHVSLKAFALRADAESWELDKVRAKVEFPKEDVGEGKELRAVLCAHYTENPRSKSFMEHLKSEYKTVGILSGMAEEIGSNQLDAAGSPMAVGLSIYAGSGATVSIYQIDFEGETDKILNKMEEQAKSYPHGFCFVFTHDDRDWIEIKDENANEQEDWSFSVRPPCRKKEIISNLRKRMPTTPIFGVNSWELPIAVTIDPSNSNVTDKSEKKLCYGFLMVTYE